MWNATVTIRDDETLEDSALTFRCNLKLTACEWLDDMCSDYANNDGPQFVIATSVWKD